MRNDKITVLATGAMNFDYFSNLVEFIMIRYPCPFTSNLYVLKNSIYYATENGLGRIDMETFNHNKVYWDIDFPVHLSVNENLQVAVSLKKSVVVFDSDYKERVLRIASSKVEWHNSVLSGVGRNFWLYDYKSDSMTTVRTLDHQGTNIIFHNDLLAISTLKGIILYDSRHLQRPIFKYSKHGIQDIAWQSDDLLIGSFDSILRINSKFEIVSSIDAECYKLIPHPDYVLSVPLMDRSCVAIYKGSKFLEDFYPTDSLMVDAQYNAYSNTIISTTDDRHIEISTIPQSVQSRTLLKSNPRIKTFNSTIATLTDEVNACTCMKNMHVILLDFSTNVFIFEITANNSFLVKVKFKIHQGYPKTAPIQPFVENQKFGDLQQDLIQIGKSFYLRGKRCMREIIEYVGQYPSRRLKEHEESVVIEDEKEMSSENVPFPCLCGVAFSPRGLAVFFSPIYLEKPMEKTSSVFRIGLQSHPRSFEMFKQFKQVAFKYLKESPKLVNIGNNFTMNITLIDDIPGLLPSTLLKSLNFNVNNFNSYYLENSDIVKKMNNPMSLFIWNSFKSASKLIERHFCQNALFSLLQQSVYRIVQKDDILLAALLAGGIDLLSRQSKVSTIRIPKSAPNSVSKKLNYLKRISSPPTSNRVINGKALPLLSVINPLVLRFVQLLNKFEMNCKKQEFASIINLARDPVPFTCFLSSSCHFCNTVSNTKRCKSCDTYTTLCAICQNPTTTLAYFCSKCKHGGHVEHIFEWFKTRSVCASGCGCNCLF
eukprot:NODE_71_length_23666_cov_0.239403.p3 type:complete len:766 gc:universal NODE_71_length_23666_cov_0.239403:12095-9798(-)